MKRYLFILVFIIPLIGCSDGADFEGGIEEVKERSIMVSSSENDPEASYPVYEVLIDNSTEISGEVDDFSLLKRGQEVDIWVINEENNNEIQNKTAEKIIVE